MTIIQPNQILTLLFLSALSVAGAAVLWRKLVNDHPKMKKCIANRLGKYSNILLCGSCFTYWLSLAFVMLFDPMRGWQVFSGSTIAAFLFHYFLSWMALAMVSIAIRFAYIAIQELVHYQVHHLHEKNHRH